MAEREHGYEILLKMKEEIRRIVLAEDSSSLDTIKMQILTKIERANEALSRQQMDVPLASLAPPGCKISEISHDLSKANLNDQPTASGSSNSAPPSASSSTSANLASGTIVSGEKGPSTRLASSRTAAGEMRQIGALGDVSIGREHTWAAILGADMARMLLLEYAVRTKQDTEGVYDSKACAEEMNGIFRKHNIHVSFPIENLVPGQVDVGSVDEQIEAYLAYRGPPWHLAYVLGYAHHDVEALFTIHIADEKWIPRIEERLRRVKRSKGCEKINLEAVWKLLVQAPYGHQALRVKLERSYDPLIVLFLTSNSMFDPLNIGKEHRELDGIVAGSERIKIVKMHDVQATDIGVQLASSDAEIIYYSGHGEKDGLVLGDELVTGRALSALFKRARSVKAVVLNACDSSSTAKMLSNVTGYAIGMDANLNDDNAIQFTKDLFRFMLAGEHLEDAFAWSKANSGLGKLAGRSMPRLFLRGTEFIEDDREDAEE